MKRFSGILTHPMVLQILTCSFFESGFGKTYAICCLLTELAQSQIPSIVFDYGQGFTTGASPRHFLEYARPIEIRASHEGVAINPLTTNALAELYRMLSRMGREANQAK
jgi:DNA phosphorothioation-dependent restriction protein DptH